MRTIDLIWGGNEDQALLPKEGRIFKEEIICEILSLPINKGDMEHLVRIRAAVEIGEISLLETMNGTSYEGQCLSGITLVVNIEIKVRVFFMTKDRKGSNEVIDYDLLKQVFLVMPNQIDGRGISELVQSNSLVVNGYVEEISGRLLDPRTIHVCLILLINVT